MGPITLASNGVGLVGLWFIGQKYYGGAISGNMTKKNDLPIFDNTKNWLDRYWNGKKPNISELSLDPIGGEFRQEVWRILCEIPYGEVTTYGEIAKKAAKKLQRETMSAQAVGGAVGHNPISVIIPCHRVIGTNGRLTGYAAGVEIKAKLLEFEGVKISMP